MPKVDRQLVGWPVRELLFRKRPLRVGERPESGRREVTIRFQPFQITSAHGQFARKRTLSGITIRKRSPGPTFRFFSRARSLTIQDKNRFVSGFDRRPDPSRPVRRIEIINGAGGRRQLSPDQKVRVLEETLAPGAVVS